MGESLNDAQVMHAMALDDMYHVQRVLARGAGELTELVTIEETGPFVRKKIPGEMARRGVWSALGQCSCARLPRVEATYELPDQFVVVYDYVPGQTVEALVKERGTLPEADAARIACEVCEAAGALHELGVNRPSLLSAGGSSLENTPFSLNSGLQNTRIMAKLGLQNTVSKPFFGLQNTVLRGRYA